MHRWLWAWCAVVMVIAVAAGVAYDVAAGHKGIREVAVQQKVAALTFDDGPDEITTPRLLNILRKYDAKATFFVMGKHAEELPGRLAQITYEGHELANHGFSHRWLTQLTGEELAEEISRTESTIMKFAPKPTLFRPPGAYYNERVIAELKAQGYTMIMWSIDARDWARTDYRAVARDVLKQVKPGSIVLLHDGIYATDTYRATAEILEVLSRQGYRFVTVSELLQLREERYY